MPPNYDIYGLSKQRDKNNVEKFLNYFSIRQKIEDREGQEIAVYKNEKYKIEEDWIPIKTLTEVIDFGLKNRNIGFAFYIGDNLKEGISHIILKFTFDNKIIFGVSISENRIDDDGNLKDNYDKALEVEQEIAKLTSSTKTSIQFEHSPSDDEDEFDSDIELWRVVNEKNKKNKYILCYKGLAIWLVRC